MVDTPRQNAICAMIKARPDIRWKMIELRNDIDLTIAEDYLYKNGLEPHHLVNNEQITTSYLKRHIPVKDLVYYYIGNINQQRLRGDTSQRDNDELDSIVEQINPEDTRKIAKNRGWTLSLIEKYCSRFQGATWEMISSFRGLSDDFIREHKDELFWESLVEWISWELVEFGKNNQLSFEIFRNPNIPVKFIRKNVTKMNNSQLRQLCENASFDVICALMNEYPTCINWTSLADNKNLSSTFIRENWDNFDTYKVAQLIRHRNTSVVLIEEKMNVDVELRSHVWHFIAQNPNLTFAFVEKHFDKFKGVWYD